MSEFVDFQPGSVPVQGQGVQARPVTPEPTPVQAPTPAPVAPDPIQKPYTLRTLSAKDIFPACQIIKKIGISEFKDVLSKDEIRAMVRSANAANGGGTSDDAELKDDAVASIGFSVFMSLANVIISNIGACEDDIYTFLSSLSGMDKKQIADLQIDIFAEMIIDIFRKPEFENFIKVVSRLLN